MNEQVVEIVHGAYDQGNQTGSPAWKPSKSLLGLTGGGWGGPTGKSINNSLSPELHSKGMTGLPPPPRPSATREDRQGRPGSSSFLSG